MCYIKAKYLITYVLQYLQEDKASAGSALKLFLLLTKTNKSKTPVKI